MILPFFTINHKILNFQVEAGDVHYKWKYDDGEIQGWQPVATLRFHKAQRYMA